MRKKILAAAVSLTVVAGGGLLLTPGPAAAVAPVGTAPAAAPVGPDELSSPMEEKRRALRSEALRQVLKGETKVVRRNGSSVVKLDGQAVKGDADQYVELSREQTDKIFVVLAEFGDERHPDFPDQDTDKDVPGPAVFDGPEHNQIPEPNRSADNTTVWQPDYSQEHFQELYFGEGADSLKKYYETQSSGRYSVDGEVSDWVKVRYNEARYGRSNGYPCASNVCSNTWQLVRDALNQWVADQEAAGRSDYQIKSDLAAYDQWDRYDFDGDGDFNESDGYLDHFQIVHAGGDQADGDPSQGEDGIWSHRWYAFNNDAGKTGPKANPMGGTEIGDTGLWAGDYTIQPENGGLSVFAHEYGHDLGLPDDYDTVAPSGVDNNTAWWTLMSQSRLGAEGDALGEKAGDLGAWNKLQLGWLDYEVVPSTVTKTLTLGPEEYNSAKAQAAVVVLPDKEVTTTLPTPTSGEYQWWSTEGDDLQTSITRSIAIPDAAKAELTFQANYNIEDCGPDPCDYAYVEVKVGGTWTAIPGSITAADQGNGIDGLSDGWVPATFDLSAYAGTTIDLRFRYVTDAAAQGQDTSLPAGLFVDDIAVTAGGTSVFTDDVETLDDGWAVDGFVRSPKSTTSLHDNFYIAGHRSYVSYDQYLKTGPYNIGWLPDRPDFAEHFAYQTGLLISYWDTSQTDNNVTDHPGEGLNLYVDAHPQPLYALTGAAWRNRVQLYDAPFSTRKADSFTLHLNGKASYIRGQPAARVFDDTKNYFYPEAPGAGVKLPAAGVKIRVVEESGTSMKIRIVGTPAP